MKFPVPSGYSIIINCYIVISPNLIYKKVWNADNVSVYNNLLSSYYCLHYKVYCKIKIILKSYIY